MSIIDLTYISTFKTMLTNVKSAAETNSSYMLFTVFSSLYLYQRNHDLTLK